MRFRKFICALVGIFVAQTGFAEDIHLAARRGDVAKLEQLVNAGNPVDQPSTRNTSQPGVTALYVAAQFGKVDAVTFLLGAGADPMILPTTDEADGTPLHMAARGRKVEILTMMLDRGADPNAYDDWVGTVLHQATVFGRQEMVDMLIARGALESQTQPPISHLLANADTENGRAIAQGCLLCHEISPTGAQDKISLWNIVGAQKAVQVGREYSDALKRSGGIWGYEDLNSFLAFPSKFIPGTAMIYATTDQSKRVDLIAYLRTLADGPMPLP
jgi:cytochrome c